MKANVDLNILGVEKVSVLVPVYNGEKFLRRALLSIKNQTIPVHEVVIVNDGSTDKSEKIINSFNSCLPIKLVKNDSNIGIQRSLRRGVECVTGTIVFRLDCDDFWTIKHVETLLSLFSSNRTTLVSSRAIYVNENGERFGISALVNSTKIRQTMIWDNPLVHSSTAFRKSAYNKVGGYELGVRWEDYNLWIKLLKEGGFRYCSVPTSYYTSSPSSLSSINKKQAILDRWVCQKQAYRAFRSGSPIISSIIFAKSFIRKSLSRLY